MARDLFIDLTNRRLVASETNSAPVGLANFTKGDNGAFNLYFLEATGVINRPFEVVDKSSTSVKLGIGSRLGVPETGTYTLTFGGDTTSAIDAAATAGAIQTALNGLSAISSAGGVSVTGELSDHFTVRFTTAGTQGSITANVSQLIPDTVAVIDERIAGSASVKEIQEIQLRLTPAVYQDSWTNLGTSVTATIATTVTGDASNNEVQRLSFSREPFAGSYRFSMPAITLADFAEDIVAVTNGVFGINIITQNHGLALNQPVKINFGGTVTGLSSNTTYFVRTIPQPYEFTVAATAGGTIITASAATEFNVTTIARQTAPISATASAADVQAALQALDSIGSGGVIVTGIQGEYFDITFSGAKGYADQPTLTVQNGTTAKPGKTADVNFSTFSLRDLLGNSAAVDLELELELTESGTRQTVILQACSVAEELIDADSFSPTSGYPSFIFQALTAAATNATTSLVAITGLNWTAQANSEYLVEWNLLCKSEVANGNIDGQVSIPAGATQFSGLVRTIGGDSLAPRGVSLAIRDVIFDDDLNAGESFFNMQKMYLQTGSTAGTVSFRFAQNAATTGFTAVIEQGSWVRAEKIK
jgi:hypothetical protein